MFNFSFFLRDHPEWLNKCRLDTQTMVTLYKKLPNSLEPKNPSNSSSAPHTLSSYLTHYMSSHWTLPHPVNSWRGYGSCSF
jgi:hypothetical protein